MLLNTSTTATATGRDPGGHNSNPALDHIQDTIALHLKAAEKSGRDSLEAYRRVGEGLAEAKEILGSEAALNAWCLLRYTFGRAWRFRLMKLAREWSSVTAALEWAETQQGRTLGKTEFSVNGALALVAEHRRATVAPDTTEQTTTTVSSSPTRKPSLREQLSMVTTQREEAETKLAEAVERIRRLEEELASANAKQSHAPVATQFVSGLVRPSMARQSASRPPVVRSPADF